jgi:pimeloyl-ACP methyl ester carboxylesterase
MNSAWLPVECPDRSRLVTLPWGRVFVIDVGHEGARPLVLLHDVLTTSYAWRHVVPKFAMSRRVIAIDLPGTGESDRPAPEPAHGYALSWMSDAIADTLATMELAHVDVMGQGFGGTLAAWFASEHPAGVGRLVLAAPFVWRPAMSREQRLAGVPAFGDRVFDRVYRRVDLRRTLASWLSAPELVDPVALDVYWDRLERSGGVPALCAILRRLDQLEPLRERLPAALAPTLVVWGDRDVVVPPEQAEKVAELLPHASWMIVDGCAHAIAEDRPDRLIEAARAHFGEDARVEDRG